ncbi:MAG TPA: hypothetical protein VGO50_04945 [Pyrinomonadaceae bacterium]|jgi:uncharacterized delta-60 repeat protein|nr:hypothetical protein [Pyrinomonadaceae bacterium]
MKKLFCVILAIGFISAGVSAQPELDATFGTGGKKVINYGALAVTRDMVIQPDNKIILASPCASFNYTSVPFCLVRLSENGSVDAVFSQPPAGLPSFGGLGVYTRFGNSTYGAVNGLALQSDGKIVAAGYGPGLGPVNGDDDNVYMVRYNASDGTMDATFGTDGIVLTDISPYNDLIQKVAVQPDGKIVAVGYSVHEVEAPHAFVYQQFVLRYLADGTLDSSFGTGGIVQTVIPGNYTSAQSMALQYDGKILVGGFSVTEVGSPAPSASYLVTRLNADGSLDPSWGDGGIKSFATDTGAYPGTGIRSLAVQLDGRVVALGQKNIFRFNTDGSLDTSFDGDGSRQALATDKGPSWLMVSASGKITVVGGTPSPSNCGWWGGCPTIAQWFLTARYLSDGSPDANYSGDGYLDIDVGGGYGSMATTVGFDPTGRLVVSGLTATMGTPTIPIQNPVFSATRLAAPQPRPVSVSGRVTGPNGNGVSGVTVSTSGVSATTNPFGFYTLHNVPTNRTYVFSVRSKTDMAFGKRTILVDDQISGLDFIGEQLDSRTIQINGPAPKSPGPSIRKLR